MMTSKPTPGPWEPTQGHPSGLYYGVHVAKSNLTRSNTPVVTSRGIARPNSNEGQANARLIAAAGTAASEVAEMGYDPVKAVKALPQVLRRLEQISDFYETGEPVAWNFGRRLQESGIMDDVATILAQAAGNGGDDD